MKTVEGKVVLLGLQGVGKTSMINRYVNKTFNCQNNPTIGASFFTCNINLEDLRIKFQVWDTAGQERFRSMAPMYYRNANSAFLIFDITSCKSFSEMQLWVTELKRNVEQPMVLLVIGNKLDLLHQRKVDSEDARKYAESIGASYHEISALTDEGVDQIFFAAASGLKKLMNGDKDFTTSLKIYDSSNSMFDHSDVPLSEESLTQSIAYGTKARSFLCC